MKRLLALLLVFALLCPALSALGEGETVTFQGKITVDAQTDYVDLKNVKAKSIGDLIKFLTIVSRTVSALLDEGFSHVFGQIIKPLFLGVLVLLIIMVVGQVNRSCLLGKLYLSGIISLVL